jgi:drug/metabolite transporter (DMT)-like permease
MKPTSPSVLRAYTALAIGVICIGTSAIFVKIANVPGLVSAFYRVFIAGIALLFLYFLRRKKRLPSRTDLGWIALGGFFFALDLALWNTSILLTSAAVSTLLANNSPLWVGLGAMLIFREKLSQKFWLGLITALIGMTLIVGGKAIQELRFNTGDLLAIATSFCYAGYMLVTQKTRSRVDTLTLNTFTMLTCVFLLLPVNLLSQQEISGFSPRTWLALIGLGLVPQLAGWLVINYAMGHLPAARVSVTLLGQVLVTAILGFLLLSETPSPADIIGGLLVLAGIYLVNQQNKPAESTTT